MTGDRRLVAVLLAILATGCQARMPEVPLLLEGHRVEAEVAATPGDRVTGLMHRRALPENGGMLFVFPRAEPHCMWMKDTHIPLSVAFLDDSGRILNVAEMRPRTRELHCAAGPARYALEMNAGWFSRRGGVPGTRVSGLEAAPRPE